MGVLTRAGRGAAGHRSTAADSDHAGEHHGSNTFHGFEFPFFSVVFDGFALRQRREQRAGSQIGEQDQQGQHEHLVELVDILQLLDLGGDDHGARAGDEDQRGDRDHGVDEVVAEHLEQAGRRVGRHHAHDGLEPAVAHQAGGGLPPRVHFGERVLHHQVGGGEKVDDVAHDHQREGVLQAGAGKAEQERQTEHHAGDGIGDERDALDHLLAPAVHGRARGDERRAVGDQRAEQGGQDGDEQRIFIDREQLAVLQDRGDVLGRERRAVGPFLHQRHHEDDRKDGQDGDRQHRARRAPAHVPRRAAAQVSGRDAVVADVEAVEELQQRNAQDAGQQHDHGHDRALVEIRHRAEHLVVQHGCDDLIPAADRGRDAEIGKAQEEGLQKRAGQRAEQRPQHRDAEGGQRAVAHQLGDRDGLFVDKAHRVVDEQEGDRHGVDHIAEQQAGKAVDVEQLESEQPGDQSLLAKRVDDGKAVGDGGQEHGQRGDALQPALEARRQTGVVDRIGERKGDHGRKAGSRARYGEAVEERLPEAVLRHHLAVKRRGEPALIKGFEQQPHRREQQEGREHNGDREEDRLDLGVLSPHHLTPPPRTGRRTAHRYCCA